MVKVHIIASETPMKFMLGELCIALCGKDIPKAEAIYSFNLETGEMSGASTIAFCKHCLELALTPIGKRRIFIYGVQSGQSVHDSQFNSQADGYSE